MENGDLTREKSPISQDFTMEHVDSAMKILGSPRFFGF